MSLIYGVKTIRTMKDKAKELVERFLNETDVYFSDLEEMKQCALICNKEKKELIHSISHQLDNDNYIFILKDLSREKQEIEKL